MEEKEVMTIIVRCIYVKRKYKMHISKIIS